MAVNEQQLRQAVSWHEAGRLEDAARVYRAFLKQHPKDARVLAMLGVLLQQQGRAEQAVDRLQQARALAPERRDIAYRLGAAQTEAGRFGGAAQTYADILEDEPRSIDALAGMTHALTQTGRPAEALAFCRRLLEINPALLPARESLAQLLLASGEPDAASNEAEQITRQHPRNLPAALVLAGVALQRNRIDEAEAILQGLGDAGSRSAEACHLLSQCKLARRDFKAALAAADAGLGLESAHQACLIDRIQALQAMGRLEAALSAADGAVEGEQPNPALAYARARVLEDLGRMEDAEAAFRKALLNGDAAPEILEALVRFQRYTQPKHPDELEIRRLLDEDPVGMDRARLHFALGKILDDQGRHPQAFGHYRRANSTVRELRPFDPERTRDFTRRLLAGFDSGLVDRLRRHGSDSRRPVFIVGMPRSGTSLVEQIIASHPEAHGAGELHAAVLMMGRAQTFAGNKNYPGCLAELSRAQCSDLTDAYLAALGANAPDEARRITDKRPANYFHLGMLLSLFPNAVAIHCTRDVRDMALSNYFQNFSEGNAFAYDLEDIVAQQQCQEALMAHWSGLFGERILELNYEALVSDFEPRARGLIGHLGLEWSARCLEYHRADRVVQTASAHQVRQPVYSGSIGRWRHYAEYLPDSLVAEPN